MRKCFLLAALALAPACHGAREPAVGGAGEPEQPLRLETVRFYEAGIAYFERAGTVRAGDTAALFVPEVHLDDALRTLVVLSGNRAVRAEFESTVPPELARIRASLPPPSDEGHEYHRILESFKNAEVEIETPSGTVRGRLTSVNAQNGLTLLEQDGVRELPDSEVLRIRPTDPELRALLERALDRAPRRDRPRYRALHALAEGGPLRVGYIAETPRWEATYRLFLPDSGMNSRLVGSVLVHNDTNEPWASVRATFASDRPESYFYDFSWPGYLRRPRVERPDELLPQLDFRVRPDLGDDWPSSEGQVFPDRKIVPRRPEHFAVTGSFEYRAPNPISVRARGSALVPFLDRAVPALPIVWATWTRPIAMRAVRIENATEQTFPGGILSAVAANGFVGEAWLSRLPPREHAFVELAEELDVTIEAVSSKRATAPENVAFSDGVLAQTWREDLERKYVIENRKATPVSVYIWLPSTTVPIVKGFDRIEDGNTESPAGVIEVEGKQRVTRDVAVEARIFYHSTIDEMNGNQLRELAVAPIEAATTRTLSALATLVDRMVANEAAVAKLGERIEDIDSDLESARSSLSSLGGNAGPAAERLVTRLLAIQSERTRAVEQDHTLHEESQRLREARDREVERLPKSDPDGAYVRRSVRRK